MKKIENLKIALQGSIAKTSNPFRKDTEWNQNLYLPLWMHLIDVGAVMDYLFDLWVPQSVKDDLLKDVQDEGLLRKLFVLLGVLHDIGKHSSRMQARFIQNIPAYPFLKRKVRKESEYDALSKYHHTKVGEKILESFDFPQSICSIVYAHHGNPVSMPTMNDLKICTVELKDDNIFTNDDEYSLWMDDWENALQSICEICGIKKEDIPVLSQSSQVLLTGYLIVADWIASNEAYFPLIDIQEEGDLNDYPTRLVNGMERIALTEPVMGIYDSLSTDDFSEQFGFTANMLQEEVLNVISSAENPGLVILEAEMGGGKTEAALAAAEILGGKHNSSGVFFGLPTQSTANGLFDRFKTWAEKQTFGEVKSFRLAHGLAKQNKKFQELFRGTANVDMGNMDNHLINHVWMEGRKQALLSDFVIGTIDQALLMALKQKHFMLRHVGLAGKVVILDEVHSYDAYSNVYIDRMLNWLGNYSVPVILLSATLPSARKKAMIKAYLSGKNKIKRFDESIFEEKGNYPLITWTDGTIPHQRYVNGPAEKKIVELKPLSYNDMENEIESIIHNEVRDGCLGIIVNTVKKAQTTAEFLKKTLSDDYEVVLFHSRFVVPDRLRIENMLLDRIGKPKKDQDLGQVFERRKKLIVVGTQVLEQSLDIDFDWMITEIAPMELVLQRIGRLWRHPVLHADNLEKHAICYVLGWKDKDLDSGTEAIYSKYILNRTQRFLPEKLYLPQDISELVEKLYESFEVNGNEEEASSWEEYENMIKEKEQRANAFRLRTPRSRKDLFGILKREAQGDMDGVEAKVRDGDATLEVIVLKQVDQTTFSCVSDEEKRFDGTRNLSKEEALEVANERIRLPGFFSKDGLIEKTICELEKNINHFPLWRENDHLKWELFLILDENNACELVGKKIRYSQETGLMEVNEKNE